jgi:DNA repair exonuclease SbcCD ATPase subunit
VAPIPPSQDAELERLLTAFADRIDAMEQDRTQITAEAARASQDELLQVRALQDGLRMRLTETEKRLAALAEPDEVGATIDELSARVAALEDAPAVLAPAAPLPGDGRFRVELRALELRMQHAEAAARENREAVLVQLERLASRIEWRLQRLEVAEQPEPEEAREERALGQVVPIRGGVET